VVEIVWHGVFFGVGPYKQRPQVGQEVLDGGPHGLAVVHRCHQRGVAGQVADQHGKSAGRKLPAVEVAQVEPVEPLQVGLYLVAVLVEQTEEAD
jgi:hypothetical protein